MLTARQPAFCGKVVEADRFEPLTAPSLLHVRALTIFEASSGSLGPQTILRSRLRSRKSSNRSHETWNHTSEAGILLAAHD